MALMRVRGDIVEVAPRDADAAVLWVSSGYTAWNATWTAFRKAIGDLSLRTAIDRALGEPGLRSFLLDPWMSERDLVLPLEPPLGRLRYLYVFANPQDTHGYADLQQVRGAVTRCLDRLRDLGVQRAAMILVPMEQRRDDRERYDQESAVAMVGALREWGADDPGSSITVLLVDLQGDFDRAL